MTALLSAGESWRVAALTMMTPEALTAALSGDEARAWVGAAAACGIGEAQVRLGRMLLEGEGVKRRPELAFAYFGTAARQGNIEARNMLGRCHENGWGTEVNYAAAACDYRAAAEAGLDWAQYNLGHLLLAGSGVARDAHAAFAWYERAAAQGHVRAMSLVGRCYEQGWGTARDVRLALLWYRRSARGGYFRGAFNYASLLAEIGLTNSARLWFARALAWAPEPTRANMRAAFRKKDRGASARKSAQAEGRSGFPSGAGGAH